MNNALPVPAAHLSDSISMHRVQYEPPRLVGCTDGLTGHEAVSHEGYLEGPDDGEVQNLMLGRSVQRSYAGRLAVKLEEKIGCTPSFLPLVVFLALLATIALGIATFNRTDEESSLRTEVERLKRQVAEREKRAALLEQEKEDLAKIMLDSSSRSRLKSLVDRSRAFDTFHRQNGFESRQNETVLVRKCLGRIISDFDIQSMLDVPCGDGHWQHLIPGIRNLTYVGGDISVAALEKAKHYTANKDFQYFLFDVVRFPLHRAFDLVLFRDAIEMLKVQDALTALLNFKESGSKLIAVTFWPRRGANTNGAGYDLKTGMWYEANLMAEPFNFPPPLTQCDNDDEGSPHHGKSILGVWRLKDIQISTEKVMEADPSKHYEELQRKRQQARGFHQAPPQFQSLPQGIDDAMNTFMQMFRPSLANGREGRHPFDGLLDGMLGRNGPLRPPPSPGENSMSPKHETFDLSKSLFSLPDFAAPFRMSGKTETASPGKEQQGKVIDSIEQMGEDGSGGNGGGA